MFKVIDRNKKLLHEKIVVKTVFGILEDSHGYPKFLFYENGQWIYHSAKNYEPYYE